MRMRKKKHTEERLAACSHLLVSDPAAHKGAWRELFGDPKKSLHLEIGCGKGAFLLEMARRHPEVLFVAIELCREALLLAVEKAAAANLSNVRFLSADAAALADYFAEGEIDRIYLNFSDPWPKSRHAKRRLTAPSFLAAYRTVLSDEGYLRQKTDNTPLFDFSLESFAACGWRVEDICRDLHASPEAADNIVTEYEANFSAKGEKICALRAYKK